jgi:3-hydroxyisobutyrate dehydrogenase
MSDTNESRAIGFIGTGVMGASMAGHLISAGRRVNVYNRSKAKAENLLARGALWRGSPGEVAATSRVVITMVGYPKDVEEVYLGPGGIVRKAAAGSVLVDMTTSSPALARRIYEAAKERGVRSLDAPVSGGDVGARNAALTIMVGGDREALDSVAPILELLGKTVTYMGGPGTGQHTKTANQIAIAGTMVGVVEAITYARKAGLDPRTVLKSIGAGSAASRILEHYAPRMLDGDFAPGFFVKHFIKDLRIALDSAREMGIRLPGTYLAERLYELLAEDGKAENGTQSLYLLYAEGKVPETP